MRRTLIGIMGAVAILPALAVAAKPPPGATYAECTKHGTTTTCKVNSILVSKNGSRKVVADDQVERVRAGAPQRKDAGKRPGRSASFCP
jgi:hypothetical protein